MGVFIFMIIVFFLVFTSTKMSFFKKRKNSLKIEEEVIKYQLEKSTMRNDYTKLKYPYVKIKSTDGRHTIEKLHYANNWSESFKIGEKINVFWSGDKLLYWNAMDKGYMSIFPSRLDFWN